jgi:hypothetical protein
MAEPESAVLPITPYPIGCLEPLVRAHSAEPHKWSSDRYCQPLSADVQTTKNLGSLVAGSPQPVQAAVAAE